MRAEPLPLEPPPPIPPALGTSGRWLILFAAFLGWFFGGVMLSTTSQVMRDAAIDLLRLTGDLDLARFQAISGQPESDLSVDDRAERNASRTAIQAWFAYYQCAFLFGAAAGGLLFGRLGDRVGRSRALAASILCFSVFAGIASLVQAPWQLLALWFLACLGVGGCWPNGVALLSETWSGLSRPLVAGVMGTSANVGIFGLATLVRYYPVTPEDWRWVLLVAACPALLGLFVLFVVPESPRWLAARSLVESTPRPATTGSSEVFRPPFLWITVVGIALATIPLIGGWGSANWMIPWAGEAGEAASPPNYRLKAEVGQARAFTGIVGSLLGGWIGALLGRRRAYFLVSLAALFCAQYTFWLLVPTDPWFLFWVGALGFFSGIYFGWLPLFLPELFPTRVRSTGAGVCFNFGRILTAFTVFLTGGALAGAFGGYAPLGRVTSLIYAVGVVVIWFAPDTTRRQLED